jgi:integrase/recombinase XerD
MTSPKDGKIIEIWLDRHPNPRTRYCYELDSTRLLKHAGKPLARITVHDLQRFAQSLIDRGLAPISRARTIAATKSLFAFCQRTRHLSANPAQELALPAYENRLSERIVAEEDVRRMIAGEQKPRNRILLNLLYTAGLRVSEACQLRWRNLSVRGDAGQITVFGKGGRTRAIVLPPEFWRELVSLRGGAGPEAPVFPSRGGEPLDRGRVRMILLAAARRVGITGPLSPHWLRHAHASHALDHGAPIHLVQATLGHSSVATTSRYLHARPGDSSARFLAPERFSSESARIGLASSGDQSDQCPDAAAPRKGTSTMKTKTANQTTTSDANVAEQGAHVAPEKAPAKKVATRKKDAPKGEKRAKTAKKAKAPKKAGKPAKEASTPHAESKGAKILALIARAKGATLAEIMTATDWQAHSVRGFISTAGKKHSVKIESSKNEAGERVYKIVK